MGGIDLWRRAGVLLAAGTLFFALLAAPVAAVADDCAAAATHWKSAEEIKTVDVYADHLARFPNCAFATLALARIAALQQATAPAAPAAPAVSAAPAAPPVPTAPARGCGAREVEKDGTCVAKTCAPGLAMDNDGDCVRMREPPKRAAAPRRAASARVTSAPSSAAPPPADTTINNMLRAIPDPNLQRLIRDNLPGVVRGY